MKLQLKIATGSNLEVNILPTDTFASLIARTSKESDIVLTLKHFELPDKPISLKGNVAYYFTGKVPDELLSSHFPAQLCRLCAKPAADMTFIFYDPNLHRTINTWLPIHVSKTDRLPKQVCATCVQQMEACKTFQVECVRAEQELKKYLADGMYSLPKTDLPSTSPTSAEAGQEIDCGFFAGPKKKLRTKPPQPTTAQSKSQDYCCPMCHAGRVTDATGVLLEESDEEVISDASDDDMVDKVKDEVVSSGDESEAQTNATYATSEIEVRLHGADDAGSDVVEIKQETEDECTGIQCRLCECFSANMEALLQHCFEAHCSDTCFPCPSCVATFDGSLDMIGHFSTAHRSAVAKELFVCRNCYVVFPSKQLLSHHDCGATNLACAVCRRRFKTKVRFEFHKLSHVEGATPLHCSPCSLDFETENESYKHFRTLHEHQEASCAECGKNFVNYNSLVIHSRFHANNRRYECGTCSKRFLDKQTLNEHMTSHMKRTPFQCPVCRRYLARKSRLKAHMLTHRAAGGKPQKAYACAQCHRVYPNQNRALEHVNSDHSAAEMPVTFQIVYYEKVFRCECCNDNFSTPESLKTHRATHTGDKRFSCGVCPARFETFGRVTSHRLKHASDAAPTYNLKHGDALTFAIPSCYLCDAPGCNKSFEQWSQATVHQRRDHPASFKCMLCAKTFGASLSLVQHTATSHAKKPLMCAPDESEPVDDAPPDKRTNVRRSNRRLHTHTCRSCEKSFVTARGLEKHQDACHYGDTYQCAECDKVFHKQTRLDRHMTVHRAEKKQCEFCQRSFFHLSSLAKHMHIHEKDPTYECELCSRPCMNRADLEEHSRIHTGEKPFPCAVCKKNFRTRSVWLQHTRIHVNARPYVCSECGVGFRRSWALKNHHMIHTGIKPFACPHCDGSFRLKQDLQRHVGKAHATNE